MNQPMHSYSIHAHDFLPLKAVKHGWSWPGFLFGGVWALFNQLWRVVCGMLLVSIVYAVLAMLSYTFAIYAGQILPLVMIMVSVAFGGLGNDMIRDQLRRLGYTPVANDVTAPTPERALNAYAIAHGLPPESAPRAFVPSYASPSEEDGDAEEDPLAAELAVVPETLAANTANVDQAPLPRAGRSHSSRAWALLIGVGVALAIWATVQLIGAGTTP